MGTFKAWYNENKNSLELLEEYQDYITEMKQMGSNPLTYIAWAKDYFAYCNHKEVPMSHITFCRNAYVPNVPSDILDAIEREGLAEMTGEGLVCIDWDDLPQEDPEESGEDSTLNVYLWDIRKKILEEDGGDRLLGHVILMN
jgi:hypothetical protein